MKVLWWLNEYPPDVGGIGTVVRQLRPHLVARGVEVTALVVNGGPSDEVDGPTRILRRPIRDAFIEGDPGAVARWLPTVTALKTEIAPDLYHVHVCEPSPILHVLSMSAHPAPTVLTLHNEMFRKLDDGGPDTLFGRLLAMAAVVTAVSNASAYDVLHHRPDLADRLLVIPNGVEIGAEPPPPPEAPTLLAVGRLIPQKGFDLLLRAMPRLVADVPDAVLTIAGDGPEQPSLMRLADDLGVSRQVVFAGNLDRRKVAEAMEAARVVVAPSRFEGMPMVVLEAGERGRCVVGADVGGINEIVVPDQTGVLVPAGDLDDPEAFAASLAAVVTTPGRAEELGAAARRRVSRHFSIERSAQTYDTVYRAAASKARPRVSVVMPAWNSARHVVSAVRSALDQSVRDLEVIVVDDGSDDDTIRLLQELDDPRLTLLPQPHRGMGPSRNAGLALARGEVIAHLDSDDLWPRDRLEILLEALDADPSLDAAFGRAVEFRDDDAPEGVHVNTEAQAVRLPTTGIVQREAHRRVGPFATVRSGDQLDWSMRALHLGLAYAQVDDVVLRRRVHARNNSHRFPFSQDRGRFELIKLALDRRRSRAAGRDAS